MFDVFKWDGPVYHFLTWVWKLLVINFLILLTSLPIITIGASQTAAFVTIRAIKNQETIALIKTFIRAFVAHFKVSTFIWLGALFWYYWLIVCWRYTVVYGLSIWYVIGLAIVSFFSISGLQYLLFYRSYVEDSFKVSLANSIKLTLAYPIQSLTLSLLFGLPLLMGLINSKLLILAIYSSSFIGLSVIQELRSRIMLRIFATIQRKQERENCEKTIY